MRIVLTFIFFFLLQTQKAVSQTLKPANCNSTILTKEEFERCKGDTVLDADIVERINYIIFLKTELLPKYRLKRMSLGLPSYLSEDLMQLKRLYDSTVNIKLETFTRDMDRNQKFLQPKAYIASSLSLETFKIYPDVYAILLNPIHLELRQKTALAQQIFFQNLVQRICNSVVKWNNTIVWGLAQSLIQEKRNYSTMFEMLQGSINEEERAAYDVVNFLLWME